MLAKIMVRAGQRLVKKYPPEGREYWSSRWWNRRLPDSGPATMPATYVTSPYPRRRG